MDMLILLTLWNDICNLLNTQPITELIYALIGNNVFRTCVGGTVIEWYKQNREICEIVDSSLGQIVRIKV